MNTSTQYISANINLPSKDHFLSLQIDLATTIVIAGTSTKVVMTYRFLGWVGNFPPPEKWLWFPNQNVQDPDTWTLSHLIQLKSEYENIVDQYSCVVQE